MSEYEIRQTRWVVNADDQKLFAESATTITIKDEAAGEFVEVYQCTDEYEGKVLIDIYEWASVRAAIDAAIKECRE